MDILRNSQIVRNNKIYCYKKRQYLIKYLVILKLIKIGLDFGVERINDNSSNQIYSIVKIILNVP